MIYFIACLAQRRSVIPPDHLHRLMGNHTDQNVNAPNTSQSNNNNPSKEININGIVYRSVSMLVRYTHSQACTKANGDLVDRGANGSICGSNARIQLTASRTVDIQGIYNHQITNITAGTVTRIQLGEIIITMHQYVYVQSGKIINSCGQMEMFQNDVNDKSLKISGGKKCITTLDGYCIPLNIHSGLPFMKLRPYCYSSPKLTTHMSAIPLVRTLVRTEPVQD